MQRYLAANLHAKDKDVLDCPCGVGWGSSLLTSAKTVTGIDISAEAIEFAQTYYSSPRLFFEVGNMATLPYTNRFDYIVFLEGMEHVTKQEAIATLNSFNHALKPGGELFLTVPVKEPLKNKNPYHLHKYSYDEAISIISPLFSKIKEETSQISEDVHILCYYGKKQTE